MREYIDCIDAGTEYCPCHLAETNECILCSQLHGSKFCDCLNWNGVCIYHEFINNNSKAKEGRDTYSCKVVKKELFEENLLLIKFIVPHKLAVDLSKAGSYVFVRTNENIYFDVPISILEADIETDIVTIMIEIRGIKTKKLLEIEEDGEITIRAPYWNGVFGLKNINNQFNSNVLVIAKGIGMAPMIPIIRKLFLNNNQISLILDKTPYKENHVKEYLKEYDHNLIEEAVLIKGELTDEAKALIKKSVKNEGVKYIHIAGADILTVKIIEYLDEIEAKDVSLSCCNNTKMCCGEGICGSCTVRFAGRRVKRLCKLQTDPRNVFEGRRLIWLRL